ncbi:MAG: DNA-directed RNA polymerase subunit RpoH/Rpb5 C-terminal domain-containing protein [Nanoarchaeota archaeon]|nr:DNA-directed RNA polymerase subunit RpoH/Rpb5 C-terminal domain-containing protein [Nanoarchaeota archaeon]
MAEEKINHILVPKHEVCTEEEVKEILSKYNIKKDQLPRMSHKDVTIVSLDLASGTVVKIFRSNKTEPNSIFYRVVV